ncbi:Guanine nucleotide-binding protein-like 1 [Gracilariopsis chorda]|uniref:Guanine nucleotide-binding protein-like 1 n=1 Tax=Gracilariopsis chorda TaxID=448386 RepID=A0A2V3IDD1_9FLOR|nr:Guanine nucleotide-binding protein-like 1 [Gracilariopsis chorda]|eukprot:PXF40095.1 Guanine nucleotide-binding protein-like 1 [Gracilariopsis chorda]
MGKKPFSAKQKRQQLRQKRLASTSQNHPSSLVHQSKTSLATSSSSVPPQHAPSLNATPRRARGRAPRQKHQRYRLHLSDNHAQSQTQDRQLAFAPLEPCTLPVTSVPEIRPSTFRMPRRPAWRYDDSVQQLDIRERKALQNWIQSVETDSYFERNLETWRQLWRVIERSDVLVLVADIRFPALHFVPDLYNYCRELGKGMVLALNKCDLVSNQLLHAWRSYFERVYPELAIAMFSSYPDAKLRPEDANSELLSKRERRMARSKLSAWGADQLLAAIKSLALDARLRGYLEEWRSQLEESDDEGATFCGASRRARKSASRHMNHDGDGSGDEGGAHGGNAGDGEDTTRHDMITIGFVGHPNAGKSSLINGIFQKKVVSTSRTPGHTKHLQTIFLCESVRLCDCPGLVFAGRAARELQILSGMFPISQVREPYSSVKYLAERVPLVDILGLEVIVPKLEQYVQEEEYVSNGWTAWKMCEAWAMKRGFRTAKAARLDVFRAANSILRLALDGRIVLATVPDGYDPSPRNLDSVEGMVEGEEETWNVNEHSSPSTHSDYGSDNNENYSPSGGDGNAFLLLESECVF